MALACPDGKTIIHPSGHKALLCEFVGLFAPVLFHSWQDWSRKPMPVQSDSTHTQTFQGRGGKRAEVEEEEREGDATNTRGRCKSGITDYLFKINPFLAGNAITCESSSAKIGSLSTGHTASR